MLALCSVNPERAWAIASKEILDAVCKEYPGLKGSVTIVPLLEPTCGFTPAERQRDARNVTLRLYAKLNGRAFTGYWEVSVQTWFLASSKKVVLESLVRNIMLNIVNLWVKEVEEHGEE